MAVRSGGLCRKLCGWNQFTAEIDSHYLDLLVWLLLARPGLRLLPRPWCHHLRWKARPTLHKPGVAPYHKHGAGWCMFVAA